MRESSRVTSNPKNGAREIVRRVQKAKRAVAPRPPIAPLSDDPPFLRTVLKLAKPRPHLPEDYALNHGHYRRGEAKK